MNVTYFYSRLPEDFKIENGLHKDVWESTSGVSSGALPISQSPIPTTQQLLSFNKWYQGSRNTEI